MRIGLNLGAPLGRPLSIAPGTTPTRVEFSVDGLPLVESPGIAGRSRTLRVWAAISKGSDLDVVTTALVVNTALVALPGAVPTTAGLETEDPVPAAEAAYCFGGLSLTSSGGQAFVQITGLAIELAPNPHDAIYIRSAWAEYTP